LLLSHEGDYSAPGTALSLLGGSQHRLDIIVMFGELALTGEPDFLDNGIP
jgi:hypothetical protein